MVEPLILHSMRILDEIIGKKRKEVASRKNMIPSASYLSSLAFRMKRASFSDSLVNSYPTVIAEFKRKSPSKGVINNSSGLYETITGYTNAGVNAISVLTDCDFFGGSLCDLQDASCYSSLPLLRKDFIIDEYQILESKAFGASCILLIASILTHGEIKAFTAIANEFDLDLLFEIHNESDLDKWCPGIQIIGVNNRDLGNFKINTGKSLQLVDKIPSECIKVAESGISDINVATELYKSGYQAFLIGENFMKSINPWIAAEDFICNLRENIRLKLY